MATVSATLPSDGETIDAADVNTPINAIITQVNGNIDSDNIVDAGVTPNKLVSGTGTSWVWQSWTPTWTNLTISSSTVVAKYTQIGKTIHFRVEVTGAGSFAVGGSPPVYFTLPVTSGYPIVTPIGYGFTQDVSTGAYYYLQVWVGDSTSKGRLLRQVASTADLTAGDISTSSPMAWANGDTIMITGTYEAA